MYSKDQPKTPYSASKPGNEDKFRGHLPLNIKLLKDIVLNPEGLIFFGRGIDSVEILARTTSFSVSAMRVEMTLADQNGSIGAMIYKKAEKETQILKEFRFQEYGWVIATASLRKVESEYLLVLQTIRNIKEYAEIIAFRAKIIWNMCILNKRIHNPANLHAPSQQAVSGESDAFGYFTPQKGQMLTDISSHVANTEINPEVQHLGKHLQDVIRSMNSQISEYSMTGIPKRKIAEKLSTKVSDAELE